MATRLRPNTVRIWTSLAVRSISVEVGITTSSCSVTSADRRSLRLLSSSPSASDRPASRGSAARAESRFASSLAGTDSSSFSPALESTDDSASGSASMIRMSPARTIRETLGAITRNSLRTMPTTCASASPKSSSTS
jgi:hypothetical protein